MRDPLIELWLIGQERGRLEARLARGRLLAPAAGGRRGQRSARRTIGRALVRAGMCLLIARAPRTSAARDISG